MIPRQELLDLATDFGLAPNVIEKDRAEVAATLKEKCEFKGIPVPTLRSIQESPLFGELRAAWEQMLRYQLPELPPFEGFWRELPDVFAWLFEKKARIELPVMAIATAGPLDAAWRPPTMATSWRALGTSAPLEIIRFAAANHLCVELDYRDENGRRSIRTIEPYSLHRSSAGNLLLFAVRPDTAESRSYRVDRIEDAKATRRPFVPRFAIELTDGGPPVVPRLERQTSEAQTPKPAKAPSGRSRPARSKFTSNGPRYVFRCMVCGKLFRRTSYDGSLNPHKGKNGYPCAGNVGIYVKTEY